ncbi:MAG: glycosyltransferase [Pyrinomonadaceae bacterium]
MNKRIMVFCDYYYPSRGGGGGMWTVFNIVGRFHDRYDFFVVARNYDNRTDTTPYTSVRTDEWNDVGNASVFYFSKAKLNSRFFAKLVDDIKPDLIFLNSVFSTPVNKFFAARRKGRIDAAIPVVLAATGELYKAAIDIKSKVRKRLFLRFAKMIGLYKRIIWKASTEEESNEIVKTFGPDTRVRIAPDLAPATILPDYNSHLKPRKEPGMVRLVWLSRIVRIKNLGFLLERLKQIKVGKVELKIIGPVGDPVYWKTCEPLIAELPDNIKVTLTGAATNDEALQLMCDSHFFVLPTLSENFGYVFVEAMAAGCPLLISDRNLWDGIESNGAGWRVPVENPAEWVERIRQCIEMDNTEFGKLSSAARAYAEMWLTDPSVEQATADMLSAVINETGQ